MLSASTLANTVSTARHEFYGLAVREAIAAGCHPLLPRRVVYPELADGRAAFLGLCRHAEGFETGTTSGCRP